jgi:hypothetical protein
MDLEATAQALVTEPVSTEQVAETSTTEAEPDYSAAYDKATADSPVEAAEAPVEAEEAPKAAEPAPEVTDAPTDVPVALRKAWNKLDADERTALVDNHRDLSRKLSEMGRVQQGLAPIQSVLVNAVKELPALANMRPDEVAQEVVTLAKISADFRTKPLETFITLAQKHNMVDALRQALGGQQQAAQSTATLQTEIAALKQQLARAADPEFIREQVSAVTNEQRIVSDIQAFAEKQDHWAEVEADIPAFIATVKHKMPNASAQDVLARAYKLAVADLYEARPDLKATVAAAVEAAPAPDPERAKAAIQAKSINVPNRTTGKAREMTDEEIYSAAYDRAARK